MADQLEAAYMLLPMVAEHAAERIGERHLEDLKKCSVNISRSIFQKSADRVWSESLTFFRLVAVGTGNDFLVRTVEQVCSADMAAYDFFFTLRREEREAILQTTSNCCTHCGRGTENGHGPSRPTISCACATFWKNANRSP